MVRIIILAMLLSCSLFAIDRECCTFGVKLPLGTDLELSLENWEEAISCCCCAYDIQKNDEEKSRRIRVAAPCCTIEQRARVGTCAAWGPLHCCESRCGLDRQSLFCSQSIFYSGIELACGTLRRVALELFGVNCWLGNEDCGITLCKHGFWCCESEIDDMSDFEKETERNQICNHRGNTPR